MTNILLIGYRGTGKTTVGRLLSERLNWAFVDSDVDVEAAAGKSIAEIFVEDGERAFRDLEQQVVAELVERDSHVISLGGGAVLREANRTAIRRAGQVVWLTASPAAIHARLTADESTAQRRPNLTPHGGLVEIEQLLTEREPLYRECATCEVSTEGRSPAGIVDCIICELRFDPSVS